MDWLFLVHVPVIVRSFVVLSSFSSKLSLRCEKEWKKPVIQYEAELRVCVTRVQKRTRLHHRRCFKYVAFSFYLKISDSNVNMSKLIDFNDNWSCSSQPTKDNDEMFVLAGTNAIDSFNGSSIVLPDENSSEQSMKCWYRKQFQLNLTNEQTEKSIELVFRQVSNSDGILSPKPILIWFNAVQIFSGTSQQSEISVELPIEVFLSNQTKNPDEKHTLIICSLHTRLSCHLSLRLPANLIENLKETPTNKTNDCSTFVSSIDHLDEQLDTISELKTSKKTKRETNLTLDHRTKPSVPLLSIVILIVGTRGDVQPFIA